MELFEFALSASLFHKTEIKFFKSLSCSFMGNSRNCCMNAGFIIQGVPLPTKPGSSLIIPKPMKILQRDLNRSTFVV